MTVADRIREKRLEIGLSQDELAKRLGYRDKTSISKIENSGDDISMKKIARVAAALGVTSAYLMGWEGENPTFPRKNPSPLSLVNNPMERKQIERALEYYSRYEQAPKSVQETIDMILKSAQQKP